MRRRFFCGLLLVLMTGILPVAAQAQAPLPRDTAHTLVLCEPGDPAGAPDPYAALAQEIAESEGLPLVTSWDEALDADPRYLLWVVAPETLSEARFGKIGLALREHGPMALGLISGSTLEDARALWMRQPSAEGPNISIVPREGVVQRYQDGGMIASAAITDESLMAALGEARCLSYQGHGTRRTWRLDGPGMPGDDIELTVDNLPPLAPAVVYAGACQTFKLWSEGAIATAFVDHGAAAYVGYLHSPQGFCFGEPKGFAAARTWPEFPLGALLAVQNRGLGQGHLAWPYLMMLGDPRLALRADPPYRVVEDSTDGEVRTLRLSNLSPGPLPVLVSDGARYDYVELEDGGTARRGTAWRGDPFYDADVQMVDLGSHKYLLIVADSSELVLRLSEQVPLWVRIAEPLGDALDHTTMVLHTEGSLAPNLVLVVLVWLIVAWRVLRHKVALRDQIVPALVVGLALTLLRGGYALLRAPYLAMLFEGYVRTMDVALEVSPWFLLSSLALTTGAAWLFLHARRPWGRWIAWPLAFAPVSVVAPFWLAIPISVNLMARAMYGTPLYGFAMGSMMGITAVIEGAVVGLMLVVAKRRAAQERRQTRFHPTN